MAKPTHLPQSDLAARRRHGHNSIMRLFTKIATVGQQRSHDFLYLHSEGNENPIFTACLFARQIPICARSLQLTCIIVNCRNL